MRSHGSLVPCVLCVIVCVVAGMAYSQEVTTSAEVSSLIGALRDAPTYERGAKRAAVVGLGSLATDPLIAAVNTRHTAEDAGFILNCVIALGELRATKATDLLIDILGERNLPLASVAASSLGQIWEGQGSQAEARPVNAALLGLLHSELPDIGVYMPALALVQVNGIPVERPRGLAADELRAAVSDWFSDNPGALPPPAQRPWQLNVYVALNDADAADGQAAVTALRQQRALGCIDPILAAVEEGNSASPELVKLMSELAGVAFPPAGMPQDADVQTQVTQWRWLWLATVAGQTDQNHVDYSLNGFEGALRRYKETPSDETAQPVNFFRMALLSQLSGPEALPASMSPKARDLLDGSLGRKQIIAQAVKELGEQPGVFEKSARLRLIGEQLRDERGREVATLFLGRLYDLAYAEENVSVATEYGQVLSIISAIPSNLRNTEIDIRRARLGEWLKEAQLLGLALDASAQ